MDYIENIQNKPNRNEYENKVLEQFNETKNEMKFLSSDIQETLFVISLCVEEFIYSLFWFVVMLYSIINIFKRNDTI